MKIAENEEEEEEDIHGFTTQEDEVEDPEIVRIVRDVLAKSKSRTASEQKQSEQVLEMVEKGMNSICQIIYYLLVIIMNELFLYNIHDDSPYQVFVNILLF
jgi:hypothetical protein